MFDVVTIGSNAVDFFVRKEFRVTHGELKIPLGTKLLVNSEFHVGGGGVNCAVTFSRLGLRTGYLGVISNDSLGELIINKLKSEGVKFIGERVNGVSGYTIILMANGSRTILINKGVNELLLNYGVINTKWAYFTSMTGKSFITQKRLAKELAGRGVSIAYNPSSYEASLGLQRLKPIIKYSRVLLLNKEEAELLSTNPEDLLSVGPSIVCVTNGSHLVKCYTKDGVRTIRPHKIRVVDATGAGDAFGSGFVAGLIKGYSVNSALRIGLLNSESVIKRVGAFEGVINSLPALN